MRKNFPSLEELRSMPLIQVRQTDINDKDEENLVQQVVNEKLSRTPEYKDIHVRNIDIITKTHDERLCARGHVCEEHWQKELDAARAKARGQKIAQTFPDLKNASPKESDQTPAAPPTTLEDTLKGKTEVTGIFPINLIPALAEKRMKEKNPALKDTTGMEQVPVFACAEHNKTFQFEGGYKNHLRLAKSHREAYKEAQVKAVDALNTPTN